ncbi:unnamed protein product, partial [Strongylus vulgaris]
CRHSPIHEGQTESFKAADPQANNAITDDPLPEYMNHVWIDDEGIDNWLFSRLILESMTQSQMKWCAWMALLCSCVSFANTRSSDDAKQIVSSFMWALRFCCCYELPSEPSTNHSSMGFIHVTTEQ